MPVFEPRRPWGWVLLVSLLCFLALTQLIAYFSYDRYEAALRTLAFENPATKFFTGDTPEEAVNRVMAELELKRGRSLRAARYYVAIKHERGTPILASELRPLLESRDRRDRALAEVYRAQALSNERADALAGALKDGDFIHQLAAQRALEKAGKPINVASPKDPKNTVGLGLLVIALMCLGIALWVMYLVARSRGHWQMLGSPAGFLGPADTDRYALRAAQMLALFLVLPFLIFPLGGMFSEPILTVILTGLMLVVGLLIFPRIRAFGKRLDLQRIGIGRENLGANIAWGFCAAIANFPLLFLALLSMMLFRGLPPPEHPISVELEAAPDLIAISSMIFAASISAPLFEEVLFRGLMLPAMAGALRSAGWGVFWSSFCFAAIHPQGIPAWPALATVAAMGAALTYQRRSLVPAIVMHATHNSLILTFALLVR